MKHILDDDPKIICIDYVACNRGCLKAFVKLHVRKWGVLINDVQLFEKEDSRWVNLPSVPFENKEGKKCWRPVFTFQNQDHKRAFLTEAMAAIDCIREKQHSKVEEELPPFDAQPIPDEDLPF